MKTILHTVDVRAAKPAAVYAALTTEEGLAGWWTRTVKAPRMKVGGVIDFRFGESFNPDMEIVALEKDAAVGWRCIGGHDPWIDDTFRFVIEKRDGGAILFFRQEYAEELSDEEYGRYNYNWGYYLESLRLLAETGEGHPFEPAP